MADHVEIPKTIYRYPGEPFAARHAWVYLGPFIHNRLWYDLAYSPIQATVNARFGHGPADSVFPADADAGAHVEALRQAYIAAAGRSLDLFDDLPGRLRILERERAFLDDDGNICLCDDELGATYLTDTPDASPRFVAAWNAVNTVPTPELAPGTVVAMLRLILDGTAALQADSRIKKALFERIASLEKRTC